MAILSGPQNAGLPGYKVVKPAAKPTPIQTGFGLNGLITNPATQNQNPWHIPNTAGNDVVTGLPAPAYVPPATAAPAPATPAPPPPPPPDFDALTLIDPEYTKGEDIRKRQNQMNLDALNLAWRGRGQSIQDNANAHGGLFSGFHNQQQTNNDTANDLAVSQQTLNDQAAHNNLYFGVFNRLKQQFANLGVT